MFRVRTIIDPEPYPITYQHLRSAYYRDGVEILGEMPADF